MNQNKVKPVLVMIAQFFANLATAVLVPTLFIYQQLTFTFLGITVPILTYAWFGVLGYAGFNTLSAHTRPGGEAYYQLDLWPSLIAAASIFGTAIAVFGFDVSKDFVAGLPAAKQMLIALVGVALYDVLINQGKNGYEMFARMTRRSSELGVVPGAFARFDSEDAFNHPLSPGDVNVRLIFTPFLKRGDGSLVPWQPQRPEIEHTPPAAGASDAEAPARPH